MPNFSVPDMDNLPDTSGNFPNSEMPSQDQASGPESIPEPEEEIEEEIEEEEEKEKDPNDMIPKTKVFDALKEASNDISMTLNTTFRKAPVCVSTLIRKDNTNDPDTNSFEAEVEVTDYLDRIFCIYEFFLKDRTNVYSIISADRYTMDYKSFKWNNVKYHGFYSTRYEAIDYVKGHLR